MLANFLNKLPTIGIICVYLVVLLLVIVGLHFLFYQETHCFSGGTYFPYCAGEDFFDMAGWVKDNIIDKIF